MNKSNIILLGVFALLLAACNNTKEENQTTTITVKKEAAPVKPDTIKRSPYTNNGQIVVSDTKYDYTYSFAPSDSLPVITTSTGTKHYDNSIRLTIRKGESVVYRHTFTKASFKRFIPEELYNRLTLMGFNFNYNKESMHDKFYFVASVGDPDDEDYYIPIDVTIDRNWQLYLDKFIDRTVDNELENVDPDADSGV